MTQNKTTRDDEITQVKTEKGNERVMNETLLRIKLLPFETNITDSRSKLL